MSPLLNGAAAGVLGRSRRGGGLGAGLGGKSGSLGGGGLRGAGSLGGRGLRGGDGSSSRLGASASGENRKLTLITSAVGVGVKLRAGTAALVHALVLGADLLCCTARSADDGSVTKVAVDANKVGGQTEGADVLDDNVTGGLLLVVGAVTARAVELAGIDDGVVADGNSTSTVVLDNLVLGLLGTASNDEGVASSENGDSIFAHIPEPDIGQSAGAYENISTLSASITRPKLGHRFK